MHQRVLLHVYARVSNPALYHQTHSDAILGFLMMTPVGHQMSF